MIFRIRPIMLLAIAPLLGGCPGHIPVGSVAEGECRAFERPPYSLRGLTRYDQDQADMFVESGVGACHWPRPAPRPAELDASPVPKSVAAVKPKPAKRGLVKRARDKLWPKTSIAPIVAPPAPPDRPVAEDAPPPDPPLPAPEPPKRKPTDLEKLLHLEPR